MVSEISLVDGGIAIVMDHEVVSEGADNALFLDLKAGYSRVFIFMKKYIEQYTYDMDMFLYEFHTTTKMLKARMRIIWDEENDFCLAYSEVEASLEYWFSPSVVPKGMTTLPRNLLGKHTFGLHMKCT